MGEIEQRLDEILGAIDGAARRSGRKAEDVSLVAVSKHHPVERMNLLAEALRRRNRPVLFGESYFQEYAQKRGGLIGSYVTHLIGPLQSNKVTKAVAEFDLIQSVHTEKVLGLINRAAGEAGKVMPIFLQVNISSDPGKSGFAQEHVAQVIEDSLVRYPHIRIEGLMTITEFYPEPEMVRPDFVQMRMLRDRIEARFSGNQNFITPMALSMGMSADFEIAIAEGATHVRIGTAILGERITEERG